MTCKSFGEGELVPHDGPDAGWDRGMLATLGKTQTKKFLSAFTGIVETVWSDGQNNV